MNKHINNKSVYLAAIIVILITASVVSIRSYKAGQTDMRDAIISIVDSSFRNRDTVYVGCDSFKKVQVKVEPPHMDTVIVRKPTYIDSLVFADTPKILHK